MKPIDLLKIKTVKKVYSLKYQDYMVILYIQKDSCQMP